MISDERIKELKEIAGRSTPGPYRFLEDKISVVNFEGKLIPFDNVDQHFKQAFDPPTALTLLDEIEKLKSALNVAKDALKKSKQFCTWLSVDSLKYPETDAGIAGKHEGWDIDEALQEISRIEGEK